MGSLLETSCRRKMASSSINTKTPLITLEVIIYLVLFVQSMHGTRSYLRLSIYFLLLLWCAILGVDVLKSMVDRIFARLTVYGGFEL